MLAHFENVISVFCDRFEVLLWVGIPADSVPDEQDRNPDEPDADVRMNQTDIDNMIERNNEFYDDDNDNDNEREN